MPAQNTTTHDYILTRYQNNPLIRNRTQDFGNL